MTGRISSMAASDCAPVAASQPCSNAGCVQIGDSSTGWVVKNSAQARASARRRTNSST
jgi:hypothetical protein